MRIRLSAFAAAAFSAALLLTAAPASAAVPKIMITKIYYDSPGTDTRSNDSRNKEFVRLKNTTRSRINLSGWTVRDKARHIYTFVGTFYLGAGASVTLRTGDGTDTAATRYWGSGNYIWNNDKDTAYVRNSAGATIDTCSYNSTRADYKIC